MTITTYKLTIECEPEVHAPIILNDIDTGQKTPHTFELAEGIYKVRITPPTGYLFREWRQNGIVLTKNPEAQVNLTGDTILTAIIVTSTQSAVESTTALIVALVGILFSFAVITTIIQLIRGIKW